MNPWSVLYYSAFIFYIFSGIYVLRLNKKAIVNRFFFLICATLAAWALGYAFSTGASTIQEAYWWRGLSTFGWTFFYSNLLVFIFYLTQGEDARVSPRVLLAYVPSVVFYWRFVLYDTGTYVQSPFGWVYLLYYKGPWSIAFDAFYLVSVIIAISLLLYWRHKTLSMREKQQAQIVMISLLGGLVAGALTDTLLPLFGIKILPLGVIFCAVAILGMWMAITKYKLMHLTQDIAAEHVLVTMKDPVIVLTPNGRIGQANRAALDITGYRIDEIIGEHVHLILPDFLPEHPIVRELSSRGSTHGYEVGLVSRGEGLISCLCSGVNVVSDFGEKIGMILVLHDITRIKESELLLKQANEALETKISKINNVFDNVHEGILTFREDLLVQGEYSQECLRIFGHPIENQAFPELLFPDDSAMRDFVCSLLKRIFEVNAQMRTLYMPLMPEYAQVGGAQVMLKYKYTKDAHQKPMIMAILTDMSEKHQLESMMEKERKTLRMVVKALLHREDFIELIQDYRRFIKEDLGQVNSQPNLFLSRIHTFKGNFSQFDMLTLVDHLHSVESQILSRQDNRPIKLDVATMLEYLEQDLAILEDVVGASYFDDIQQLKIERQQLEALKESILQHLGPAVAKPIMERINRLYYKSIKDMLSQYPDYTLRLAERWDKVIAPFEIEGDAVMVDPEYFQDFVRQAMHLFRNAVAHGIEAPDDRVEAGKSSCGHIRCCVHDRNQSLLMTIEDDGRGIEPTKIAGSAISQGLISREAMFEMEDQALVNLIFLDYLSTAEATTPLCGRGMGLASVKRTVEQMGGSIAVETRPDKGTKFSILLPKAK